MKKKARAHHPDFLAKTPTNIQGFDEITGGGLPKGRPTLVTGGPGCGKTLFAMEFIVRGALQNNEPGVFISFEESEDELTKNVASLGYDLKRLEARKMLWIEHIHVAPGAIQYGGEYDLEGLFIRIHHAIESIGAKRVVLDTMETLFALLPDPRILRTEFHRLLSWLKKKGVTTIVTSERADDTTGRYTLEEYVADCVILLDHRVTEQSSIRRLRIVKYRGSTHGTNEYPFLIDETGFFVLPVTSMGLDHLSSSKRISTGIPRLDTMLSGKGYFRGSTVLISGSAGTGKTSIAAHFVDNVCRGGERVLFFTYEESPSQLVRNMLSIGLDLQQWVRKGLLVFQAARPSLFGLESHLSVSIKLINQFDPSVVIFDPINAFVMGDNRSEVKAMLLRLIDFLKMKRVTTCLTSLTSSTGEDAHGSDLYLSSLIDTWMLLRDIEIAGERNHGLYVIKSRGMAHSNQIREFSLTDHGIELRDVYVGADGVLTGSARLSQEMRNEADQLQRRQDIKLKQFELKRRRNIFSARLGVIQSDFDAEERAALRIIGIKKAEEDRLAEDAVRMGKNRKGDAKASKNKKK